jgi:hypothetical protein
MLENIEGAIKKGQSRETDNKTKTNNTNTHHNDLVSNFLMMNIPDEDYSRQASCALY